MSGEKAVSRNDLDGIYPHHTGRKNPTEEELPDTGKLATLHRDMGVMIKAARFAVDKLTEPCTTVEARQARAVLVDALKELTS